MCQCWPGVLFFNAPLNLFSDQVLQICVAPDYVLVLREVEEAFIAELTAVYVFDFPPYPIL